MGSPRPDSDILIKLSNQKLRAVAAEITRTADLLDGKIEDKIGFFAEKGDKGSPWLNETSK